MGLCTLDIVRIIKIIKSRDVKRLCMIGRQNINTTWEIFTRIIETFGWSYNKTMFEDIKGIIPIDTYKFFEMFGLEEVHAIDYNEIDGADIIFDLNSDLPVELRGKYDLVLDGGTLEHVFDVAKAMVNISDMVCEGGIVVHILPVAGYVEHGFYSFSPTFFTDFYRVNHWDIIDLNLEFRMTKDILQPEWSLVYSQDCRLFQNYKNAKEWFSEQKRINDYVNKISSVETMGNTMIWCIARRNNLDKFKYPIQGVYDDSNTCEVTNEIKKVDFQKIMEIIEKNSDKQIALFGAGDICNQTIDYLYHNDLEENIEFVFDTNIEKAGTSIRGYKIVYPTKKKLGSIDVIIICTNKFENEIYNFLKRSGVEENKIEKITMG